MATTESKKTEKSEGIGDFIKVIVQAVLIAVIFQTFIYKPFTIPSGSMKDTLLVGDYLFVSKFSYGYSKHSFPYSLAPFSGRIWSENPERGDVAVFKFPRDNSTDYIKRVIGLPGDTIQMTNGVLQINGTAVPKVAVADATVTDSRGRQSQVKRFEETLPNGVKYHVLDFEPNGLADNTDTYIVPEDHYFMMGDNRDRSSDSRFLTSVGFVPLENFVGRAEIIFFSVEEGSSGWQFWKWPVTVRFARLLNLIN
jgi:signal peptidase I